MDLRDARSVGYDRVTLDLPVVGSVDWLVLVISDAEDACTVVPAFSGVDLPTECEEQCAHYQDKASRGGVDGEEAWGLTLALNPSDTLEASYAFDVDFEEVTFYGHHRHWQLGYLQDSAGCVEACRDGVAIPTEHMDVSGGDVDVSRYDPDGVLKAKVELAFGLNQVSGSLRAFPCDLSAWAWWERD